MFRTICTVENLQTALWLTFRLVLVSFEKPFAWMYYRNFTQLEYYCYDKYFPYDTLDTFTTGLHPYKVFSRYFQISCLKGCGHRLHMILLMSLWWNAVSNKQYTEPKPGVTGFQPDAERSSHCTASDSAIRPGPAGSLFALVLDGRQNFPAGKTPPGYKLDYNRCQWKYTHDK